MWSFLATKLWRWLREPRPTSSHLELRVASRQLQLKQCEMLRVAFEMEMERASFHAPVASSILRLASNVLNSTQEDEIDAALEAATSEAEQVFALCHASIFLGAELLQRAACKRVAAMIEPLQTPSCIRAALGITADLSADEERAALAEPLFATAAPLAEPAAASSSGLPSSVPVIAAAAAKRAMFAKPGARFMSTGTRVDHAKRCLRSADAVLLRGQPYRRTEPSEEAKR